MEMLALGVKEFSLVANMATFTLKFKLQFHKNAAAYWY